MSQPLQEKLQQTLAHLKASQETWLKELVEYRGGEDMLVISFPLSLQPFESIPIGYF